MFQGLAGFIGCMMLIPTFEQYTWGVSFKCAIASAVVELLIAGIIIVLCVVNRGRKMKRMKKVERKRTVERKRKVGRIMEIGTVWNEREAKESENTSDDNDSDDGDFNFDLESYSVRGIMSSVAASDDDDA